MACNETYIFSDKDIKPFDFPWIWEVQQKIAKVCLNDPRLASPINPALTTAACQAMTGENSSWFSYSPYKGAYVWQRFATWKLPLVQLLFQFPRPPLGWKLDVLMMNHLLGDPVDTIANLVHTLHRCRTRALEAQRVCQDALDQKGSIRHQEWKALALLAASFDECGEPEKAKEIFLKWGNLKKTLATLPDDEDISGEQSKILTDHLMRYENAANELAADRATRLLPIMLAQGIFMSAFSIAFAKAGSSPNGPSNWLNVEAHSIATSALYYWAISAVFLASMIGVSQSETSLPRILSRFNIEVLEEPGVNTHDVDQLQDNIPQGRLLRRFSSFKSEADPGLVKPSNQKRVDHGGLYSWRPSKWRRMYLGIRDCEPYAGNPILYSLLALTFVSAGVGTALIVAFRVPPDGSICRPMAQVVIFGTWFLSFLFGILISLLPKQRQTLATFLKDTISTLVTCLTMAFVQFGISNRCVCWSRGAPGGNAPLALPQDPIIEKILTERIHSEYIFVVVGGIVFELALTAAVAYFFRMAIRVYVQRDDSGSNIAALRRTRERKRAQVQVRAQVEVQMRIQQTSELKEAILTIVEPGRRHSA